MPRRLMQVEIRSEESVEKVAVQLVDCFDMITRDIILAAASGGAGCGRLRIFAE
jgi:hypothetical protein